MLCLLQTSHAPTFSASFIAKVLGRDDHIRFYACPSPGYSLTQCSLGSASTAPAVTGFVKVANNLCVTKSCRHHCLVFSCSCSQLRLSQLTTPSSSRLPLLNAMVGCWASVWSPLCPLDSPWHLGSLFTLLTLSFISGAFDGAPGWLLPNLYAQTKLSSDFHTCVRNDLIDFFTRFSGLMCPNVLRLLLSHIQMSSLFHLCKGRHALYCFSSQKPGCYPCFSSSFHPSAHIQSVIKFNYFHFLI